MIRRETLIVGGLTPFSTVDWPGHLAAVVFCQGCSWHCAYCQNPHLQARTNTCGPAWAEIVDWLETRRGLLESVVFSGGEPLSQERLAEAMHVVRERGFRVGLHTTGVNPKRFAEVLPLVDWVGFDIKAAFGAYPRVTGRNGGAAARISLRKLLDSGKAHEIRCTVDNVLLSPTDGCFMAAELARIGVSHLVLQPARNADGVAQPVRHAFVSAVAGKIGAVELR